jgi:glutathione S-transferase
MRRSWINAIDEEIPGILDDLESLAPAQGWLFGDVSIPTLRSPLFLATRAFARYFVDAARWPNTAAWIARCPHTLASCGFARMKRCRTAHRSTGIATCCALSVRRSWRKVTVRRDRGGAF